MSILLKINLCGNNFPESCEFGLIWRKSIPKKFSFQGPLQKLIPAKKFVLAHLPQLMRDWSFKFTFTRFYY